MGQLTFKEAMLAVKHGFIVAHEEWNSHICAVDGELLSWCSGIEDDVKKTGTPYDYDSGGVHMPTLGISDMLSEEPEWNIVMHEWDTNGIFPFIPYGDCPNILIEQARLQFPGQYEELVNILTQEGASPEE